LEIALLQQEILRSMRGPNFISAICQSFECVSRQRLSQQGNRFQDDMLGLICKLLKLSTTQTCALSFALTQSPVRSLSHEAFKLFKAKLPDVDSFNDLHEDVLHHLVHYLTTTEVRCVVKLIY